MDINNDWHEKHKLTGKLTPEQRVKWHIEHSRRCSCGFYDPEIVEEVKKRYLGKHQDFWIEHNRADHMELGKWAAVCSERMLPYFEAKCKKDSRPRDAIIVLRQWAETGEFCMNNIRTASLAAHAAAKDAAFQDKAACFAAHAAGQAVATAHAPTHAIGVILYGIKLTVALDPSRARSEIVKEREWQMGRLSGHLHEWVERWVRNTEKLLPRDIQPYL